MSANEAISGTVHKCDQLHNDCVGFYRRIGKRCVDFMLSMTGLLILFPALIAVAIAVKLTSRGPVFYLQERVGRYGKPFKIIKFRSMIENADRLGPAITRAGDMRVTRLGLLLRNWKLDELPQLWNVVRGDMSFVGPRPEVPRYVEMYSPKEKEVLSVRPGITDSASLAFRHEEKLLVGGPEATERLYRQVILPQKLALNLEYISQMSLINDWHLIIRTLVSIVTK